MHEFDAAFSPAFHDGERTWSAPDACYLKPREVGRFKVRMLHHELIWRRHTKEVRDLVGGVADDAKCFAGFKGAGDDDPSAGMKHGVGVTVESAGVEQRQDHELHSLWGDSSWNT